MLLFKGSSWTLVAPIEPNMASMDRSGRRARVPGAYLACGGGCSARARCRARAACSRRRAARTPCRPSGRIVAPSPSRRCLPARTAARSTPSESVGVPIQNYTHAGIHRCGHCGHTHNLTFWLLTHTKWMSRVNDFVWKVYAVPKVIEQSKWLAEDIAKLTKIFRDTTCNLWRHKSLHILNFSQSKRGRE